MLAAIWSGLFSSMHYGLHLDCINVQYSNTAAIDYSVAIRLVSAMKEIIGQTD